MQLALNFFGLRSASIRERTVRAVGQHHDLLGIFHELNVQHFCGEILARPRWGNWPSTRRRARAQRSIRLGSYVPEDGIIRVHPYLDQNWVPHFFVRYIMFHEMLHEACPPVELNGRRYQHHRVFRERERAYPDYLRAITWERRHIHRLLRNPPTP